MIRGLLAAAGMLVTAMAAPPAMALSAQVNIVFFFEDSDELASDGTPAIERVVAEYRRQPFKMFIRGYTDRTGSAAYNQRLSERRAKIVADALARLGVSRSDMVVSGRGENDNRVPTGLGMPEPQNRRVEIRGQ